MLPVKRLLALVLTVLAVVPSVHAHEEDQDEHDDAAPDPLARYRDEPWYSILDDRWWVYGQGEKIVPPASLPTSAYRSDWEIAADGDWVVWIDQSRRGGDVFAYNLDARSGLYLTNDDARQHNPAIHGSLVAWEDERHGQTEIYAYDLETSNVAFRVTNSTATQRNPAVGIGWIAYEDRSDLANGTNIGIWHRADGANSVLVGKTGDQTAPALAGEHVAFVDQEYGQTDVMAVRASGGRPFFLTRDTALETAPVSSGAFTFFLHAADDTWELLAYDGVRNVTRNTGYTFDATARMDVERGMVVFSTYRSGGNSFVTLVDLDSGRYARLTDNLPLRGPPLLADGRLVFLLSGEPTALVVLEPSRFAVESPPRMRLVGPPPEAPFTGPRFTANGTFRSNPGWGEPLRFEYRFDDGPWTAFDAREGPWEVAVDVPRGFDVGDKTLFQVRAVFQDAPEVTDAASLTYTTFVTVEHVYELPELPLAIKLKRMTGAIVLASVLVVFLGLLVVRFVVRGTFKRLVSRRVDAEYVRPEEPGVLR